MKRVLFVVGLALVTGLMFTSCRKCVICTAYNVSDNTVYYVDKNCGMSVEVNSWQDDFNETYDYGSTYVECEKDN